MALTHRRPGQYAHTVIRKLNSGLPQWMPTAYRDLSPLGHAELKAEGAARRTWKLVFPGADDRPLMLCTDNERTRFESSRELAPQLVRRPDQATLALLWAYGVDWYWTETDLDADDVAALVSESKNRKRLRLEKAHALQAMKQAISAPSKRQPIPQPVKLLVWRRDGGQCVECGSQKELEFDHVIPLAMGGSNTERNLQLLCAVCNRRKGPTLG
jgi:hypothetical protein